MAFDFPCSLKSTGRPLCRLRRRAEAARARVDAALLDAGRAGATVPRPSLSGTAISAGAFLAVAATGDADGNATIWAEAERGACCSTPSTTTPTATSPCRRCCGGATWP